MQCNITQHVGAVANAFAHLLAQVRALAGEPGSSMEQRCRVRAESRPL